MSDERKPSELRRAIFVGVRGIVLAMLCSLIIFRDSPGSEIRPMDIPCYQLIIAIGTAGEGFPLAWTSWKQGRRFGSLAAYVLCLSPFFAGGFSLIALAEAFRYELKP